MAATRPRAREGLEVFEFDDGSVVYDQANDRLHHLNTSGALVLSLCDGTATIAQMAEAIADVYGAPPDEVEAQVRELLKELRADNVLEPTRRKKEAEAVAAQAEDLRELARIQVPKSA